MNGVAACGLLTVGGVAALLAGCFSYRRKEVRPAAAPLQLPGRWWAWVMLFLLGLALALLLIGWLARQVPVVLDAG
jgi:hypothetical protein